MSLWQVNDWYAVVKRGPEQRKIALDRPIALIGGHEQCDVTIADRSAAVAYIAVAYDRHIEIWPTCPLAFSLWGKIKRPETELLIGRSRVSLGWSAAPGASTEMDWTPGADLIVDWGVGEKRRKISRPVSILGEDHPSVIRLHGTTLERCDQAIICFGETVWMVDLCTKRWDAGEPQVRKLIDSDPSVFVGGLHFWCASKSSADGIKRVKSASDRKSTAQLAARMENTDPEVDQLTTRWTDRMLETTARRSEKVRIVKLVAFTVVMVAALVTVVLIIIQGIAPILRSIYGE